MPQKRSRLLSIRLRRFLPPQVADLIVASGTEKQLENHRREITPLFCDLRGFTGFSESSDPEEVMAYASAPSCRLTPRNCLFLCSSSSLYDVVSWNRGLGMRGREFIKLIDDAATARPFSVCTQLPSATGYVGPLEKVKRDYERVSRRGQRRKKEAQ
jgi:hypothetical protein